MLSVLFDASSNKNSNLGKMALLTIDKTVVLHVIRGCAFYHAGQQGGCS